MASSSQTFSATGTFTWPAGVQWATVECWGGGAAGGGGTGNPSGGGGGSGGTYSKKVFQRPSAGTDTVTVGAEVTGTTGAGSNGNDTWFRSNDSAGCVAKGGIGGGQATVNSTSAAGGTATTTGCVGDVFYAGGNGGTGASGATAGGGGEAANEFGVGAAGGATTAGSGNGSGGDGGNGGLTTGNGGSGNPGQAPGGGGGGGRAGNNTDRAGGNGAPGQIVVSWNPQQVNTHLSVKADSGISVGEHIR